MRLATYQAMLSMVCALAMTTAASAAYEYEFVVLTGFYPDWSIDGGNISVSNDNGLLGDADITDWTVSFTVQGATIALEGTNSDVETSGDVGPLFATPTGLYLTSNVGEIHHQVRLFSTGIGEVRWSNGSQLPNNLYARGWHVQGADIAGSYGQAHITHNSAPWLIATRDPGGEVPEPSSFLVFLGLGLCVGGLGVWRRRPRRS